MKIWFEGKKFDRCSQNEVAKDSAFMTTQERIKSLGKIPHPFVEHNPQILSTHRLRLKRMNRKLS